MLDLMRETGELPTVDAVAARAGVSRRSVFRLFKDTESLIRRASEIQRAEVFERFMPPPPVVGTLQERAAALMAFRVPIYEFVMPTRRIAERRRSRQPGIDRQLAQTRAEFRKQIEVVFGSDLPAEASERADVLDALELAASWGAWRILRDEQGCTVERAQRTTVSTLIALLRRPT